MLRKLRRYSSSASYFVQRQRSFFLFCVALGAFIGLLRYLSHGHRSDEREADAASILNKVEQFTTNHGDDYVAAVLVICASRASALSNHLTQLLAKRPAANKFPVVISQDGSTNAVTVVADEFMAKFKNVSYMKHKQDPVPKGKKKNNYAAIASHYKWALDRMFVEFRYSHVIITEDDLDVGNDFFSYFEWAKQVLEKDNTLWCASAWNDNGLSKLTDPSNGDRIWRTDFFPGLGWLLSADVWKELSGNWPSQYWDDWMRQPEIRKNRSCIRPETCRTAHNMKLAGKGSSGGMYKSYLSSIQASQSQTDFSLIPPEAVTKSNYDTHLAGEIKNAKLIEYELVNSTSWNIAHQYKIAVNNVREWYGLAAFFGIMNDVRGGMQRTAYYGVVPLMHKSCRVFIVPQALVDQPRSLTSHIYDPTWDKKFRFLEFQKLYCRPDKWTGVCDPKDERMIAWFARKNWKKRLADWGDMIVN